MSEPNTEWANDPSRSHRWSKGSPLWWVYLKIFGLTIVLIVAVVAKYYYIAKAGNDVRELFTQPSNNLTTLSKHD